MLYVTPAINIIRHAQQTPIADKWQLYKSSNPSKTTSRWQPFLMTLTEEELSQLQSELPTWRLAPQQKQKMMNTLSTTIQQRQNTTEPTLEQPLTPEEAPQPVAKQAPPNIEQNTTQNISKFDRVTQLENLYRTTWNFFSQNLIPRLSDNVQQANALNALFNEVRPVWKGLRLQIQRNPQLAEQINDQYLEQANAALGDASQALQQLVQSDTIVDNHIGNFQSQLTRAFNAIRQLSFDNSLTQQEPADATSQSPIGATNPAEWLGKQVGRGVKYPGRALNRMKNWVGEQSGNFGRGFSQAESELPIITAEIGSAHYLFSAEN